jgi:hypothetical protein
VSFADDVAALGQSVEQGGNSASRQVQPEGKFAWSQRPIHGQMGERHEFGGAHAQAGSHLAVHFGKGHVETADRPAHLFGTVIDLPLLHDC